MPVRGPFSFSAIERTSDAMTSTCRPRDDARRSRRVRDRADHDLGGIHIRGLNDGMEDGTTDRVGLERDRAKGRRLATGGLITYAVGQF